MPVDFYIKPGGAVTIKPSGYHGSTCHDVTRSYEDRLEGRKSVQEGEEGDQATVHQSQQQKTQQ